METKERLTRISSLMQRRDEIASELATAENTVATLKAERATVNGQLSELVQDDGAPPPPASGRKCGNCGKEGHTARNCPDPKKGT